MFFGKKEMAIIQLFNEHLDFISRTLENLEKVFLASQNDDLSSVEIYSEEVRKMESAADAKRREMENSMYQGAFLPNFRGDFLGLAESFDKVANEAENVVDQIVLQHLVIPSELKTDFLKQVQLAAETFEASREAAVNLFQELSVAEEKIKETERLENTEDSHERALVKKIFEMNLSLAEKRQLRELVLSIGDIANLSEDCSDRMEIIVLKRRV
ncbi:MULTISPECIES: TIGR00153 family protein [unclassified Mesotoga]|nr:MULTISPECIES: TIGR00153 family protein [unclassified Mesotoga]MDI9367419.1 TIGR00153 family protein [Thermotogota bacterium]MDD3681404.1 TIGR00153 family protein [Mesotoga sp.]MDD4207798.1 TIGR00153 family protein [Mesotoga sp.]MDD4825663.1 TIGR00153 family protein [Mesotoga sp.]RLL81600.1 phosphate transport system regulatory protein PhoU [Mesotoga sp. BH458_6_3_2_1]